MRITTNKLLGWLIAIMAVFALGFFIVNGTVINDKVTAGIESVLPEDEQPATPNDDIDSGDETVVEPTE